MTGTGALTQAGYRPAWADTFPKLLRFQAATRGDRPAAREKAYGIWESWTWAQVRDHVRDLACGLHVMGLQRGDKIAIVGDNRPRLYWTFVAAQSLGAIPVPVYQDSVAEEMRYVLDHAEVRFAVAEDQEQVDKLLEIKARCPLLERIVYEDPRGTTTTRRWRPTPRCRTGAASSPPPIPAFSTPRWTRARAATSPSCSTPPAPPASPRAAC
jgi:long-subunit acyl-CoA synthetase (AMP-forming)